MFSVIQVSAQAAVHPATCLLYYHCIEHHFSASWTNASSFTDTFLVFQIIKILGNEQVNVFTCVFLYVGLSVCVNLGKICSPFLRF